MIIFLYGEDTFRSRQKLKEFKKKYNDEVDPGGSGLIEIDGAKIRIEELKQALGSPSLFARKRMLVVENIFKNQNKEIFKSLRDYLVELEDKKKDSQNIVIFIDEHSGKGLGKNVLWKKLGKEKIAQNFDPLSATAATKWVAQRAGKLGAKLTPANAMKLTGLFGSDLWRLDNELRKIISYLRGKENRLLDSDQVVIGESDIVQLSRGKLNENIFALTDAISNKNKYLAMDLLERELEIGQAEQYLMHMILRQFRILLQVRQALDSGLNARQVSSELKLHPYVAQKSLAQARAYSLDFLKKIFSSLTKIDNKIKTGQGEFRTSIEFLIAGL